MSSTTEMLAQLSFIHFIPYPWPQIAPDLQFIDRQHYQWVSLHASLHFPMLRDGESWHQESVGDIWYFSG